MGVCHPSNGVDEDIRALRAYGAELRDRILPAVNEEIRTLRNYLVKLDKRVASAAGSLPEAEGAQDGAAAGGGLSLKKRSVDWARILLN